MEGRYREVAGIGERGRKERNRQKKLLGNLLLCMQTEKWVNNEEVLVFLECCWFFPPKGIFCTPMEGPLEQEWDPAIEAVFLCKWEEFSWWDLIRVGSPLNWTLFCTFFGQSGHVLGMPFVLLPGFAWKEQKWWAHPAQVFLASCRPKLPLWAFKVQFTA